MEEGQPVQMLEIQVHAISNQAPHQEFLLREEEAVHLQNIQEETLVAQTAPYAVGIVPARKVIPVLAALLKTGFIPDPVQAQV
ncbi:hypothetical protein D1614_15625 [Maribellus luteus]|uniref:Uncharacterized protein n=1 Tax=Maribellus luteus TaxID=2305463 RepID=A0A399SYU8_9BACT|nr:hypothetical protein D1614_15625 [Maribellus luteus]